MFNVLSGSFVVALGAINVALIDLIVLTALLVAIIYGLIKGFAKQILSLLGWIVALILAISFSDEISAFIFDKIPSIPSAIEKWLNSLIGFDLSFSNENSINEVLLALQKTNLPEFLHTPIAGAIVKAGGELKLTTVVSGWIVNVISFITIFLLSLILFGLLKKVFSAINKINILGKIDKTLGAIFSVLKLFIILILVFLVLSIFMDVNAILTPITKEGNKINSLFNIVLSAIMKMPFISNILSSIF